MSDSDKNLRNDANQGTFPDYEGLIGLEVPKTIPKANEKFWNRLSIFQLVYSMTGLILGIICILVGVYLFIQGVSGISNISTKFLGSETTLTDAAPGAVLFVIGLLIVFITRFRIKIKK